MRIYVDADAYPVIPIVEQVAEKIILRLSFYATPIMCWILITVR